MLAHLWSWEEVLEKIKRIESTGLRHSIPHIWGADYDLHKLVRQRTSGELPDEGTNVFHDPVYGQCVTKSF